MHFSTVSCFSKLKMEVTQLCPSLWDPVDYTIHGILQARILEWVAIPSSRGFYQSRGRTPVSRFSKEEVKYCSDQTLLFLSETEYRNNNSPPMSAQNIAG